MPPAARRSVTATLILWGVLLALAVAIDIPVSHWIDRYEPIGRGKKAPAINLIKQFGDFRFIALAIVTMAVFHRARWRSGIFLLTSCAISGALYGTKWMFGRHRPSAVLEPFTFHPFKDGLPGIVYAQQLSLPSGHACLAFAAASGLTFLVPRWGFAFYGVAMILGLERVLEGAHYPSDVVLGAGFGFLSTALAKALARQWFGPGWNAGVGKPLELEHATPLAESSG